MRTTSENEWAFVCDDEVVDFPRETDWLSDPAVQFKLRAKKNREWRKQLLDKKNGVLKAKHFTMLLMEELIAARLYTGTLGMMSRRDSYGLIVRLLLC